ncbi:hypothetical protein L7F22_001306 [Adiantum nelumboides]|nr:hypothetical protein [Adiantum nelumboides]
MVGKAHMSIVAVNIDNVRPITGSQIGHQFDLKAKVKVSKRTLAGLSGEGIDVPELEWKETIEWFERQKDGKWHFKGKVQKDMYKDNPDSNTFRVWREMPYVIASDPLNNAPQALKDAVKKEGNKGGKHWIANNGFEWTLPAVHDTPALGLNPAAGSHGGGGQSLVTSNTRRRVIYFDLGFKGSPMRVSATQILETVDGKPTIVEFFHPTISKTDADNPTKLDGWRAKHK